MGRLSGKFLISRPHDTPQRDIISTEDYRNGPPGVLQTGGILAIPSHLHHGKGVQPLKNQRSLHAPGKEKTLSGAVYEKQGLGTRLQESPLGSALLPAVWP